MPRPADIDRPTQLVLMLPTSIRARLDLFLFSSLEGRVPLGAYKAFFIERIQEFFGSRRLELERFGLPAGFYVSGPVEMINALEERLKR